MNKNKDILLYSGGLDSMCSYHLLEAEGVNVQGFYIPHDLEYGYSEKMAIETAALDYDMDIVTSKMKMMYLSEYEDEETGFIPLRNLLFAAIPAMEGANRIYLGAVAGEYSLDKSEPFFKRTGELFSFLLGRNIEIEAPYSGLTKTELVRKALRSGVVTEEMLLSTRSCYHQIDGTGYKALGCGECMACMRRWIAMVDNGIEEKYERHPSLFFHEQLNNGSLFSQLRKQPKSRWPELVRNNAQAFLIYRKHKDFSESEATYE